MRVIEEGTITIKPDGCVHVTGFKIDGTLDDLMGLVRSRIETALSRWQWIPATTARYDEYRDSGDYLPPSDHGIDFSHA